MYMGMMSGYSFYYGYYYVQYYSYPGDPTPDGWISISPYGSSSILTYALVLGFGNVILGVVIAVVGLFILIFGARSTPI